VRKHANPGMGHLSESVTIAFDRFGEKQLMVELAASKLSRLDDPGPKGVAGPTGANRGEDLFA